jgi:hypothetical protein
MGSQVGSTPILGTILNTWPYEAAHEKNDRRLPKTESSHGSI